MSERTYHTDDCNWIKTTPEECAFRATHYYCPHPEHMCDCDGAERAALRVHIEAVEAAGYTVTKLGGSDE